MSKTEQDKHRDSMYKASIMVIDDNPEFITGIELILEMEGFKVLTAENGKDALNQLWLANQAGDPPPDLFLVDIMMPVMDGYTFHQEMQKHPLFYRTPILFLTAKASDADKVEGLTAGVDDYLSKLSPSEVILASIRGKIKRARTQEEIDKIITRRTRQSPTKDDNQENADLNLSLDPTAPKEAILIDGRIAIIVAVIFIASVIAWVVLLQ